MILHTLNALPDSAACSSCLELLASEDSLLLTGEGVYAGLEGSPTLAALQSSGAALYALQGDCAAAGVAQGAGVSLITVDGFVKLTEQHEHIMAWY